MSDNVVHAVAGAGGGMISMTLTYPLITIATRLQVQKNSNSKDAYKNSFDAFTKILSQEGIPGLYSGLNSALFGIAVTNGIYYYWYETVRDFFEGPDKKKPTTLQMLLSGAIAGATTAVCTNPIWVVNTRLTAKNKQLDDESGESGGKHANALQVAYSMLKEDGIFSFFQGLLPALVLVINPTIQYFIFEKLKTIQEGRKGKLGDFDFFVLGAISKLIATVVTYPYIVVKSRMQLKQSADNTKRYSGIRDAFHRIIKEEGVEGLYKGLSSKIFQSVLTAAVLFLAKERLFQFALKLIVLLRGKAENKV